MNPEFHEPTKPAFIVTSADIIMEHHVKQLGSVAKYINSVNDAFMEHPEYKSNLLQLERMAHFLTNDELALPADNRNASSGFYWGGVLGLALGEYVHYEDWSDVAYEGISSTYYAATNQAENERREPFLGVGEGLYASPASIQTTNAADIMTGTLEIDDMSIPESYLALIDTWADELSDRPQTKAFIVNGFKFVASHAFVHEAIIRKLKLEALEKAERDALLAYYDFDPDSTD